eukprot:5624662-Pyramimonas_sp.AAC.1
MGPACVQVALQIALAVKEAGDRVGGRNKEEWATHYAALEPMPIDTLTMVVRGCRVSQCRKENQAKL